jgi:hypothetical protein
MSDGASPLQHGKNDLTNLSAVQMNVEAQLQGNWMTAAIVAELVNRLWHAQT